MAKRLWISALFLLGCVAPATATPIVITFEDQADSIPFQTPFPDLYMGVTWTDWRHYAPYGPNGYDADGVNAIYAAVDAASFTFADAVFDGAWFSAPFLTNGGQIYFELYNNGGLVHTSGALTQSGPLPSDLSFLSSGYGGLVDQVHVKATGAQMLSIGAPWIMDNVTFNTDVAAPVPEPVSLLLVGGGFVGVAVRRYRRRRAADRTRSCIRQTGDRAGFGVSPVVEPT